MVQEPQNEVDGVEHQFGVVVYERQHTRAVVLDLQPPLDLIVQTERLDSPVDPHGERRVQVTWHALVEHSKLLSIALAGPDAEGNELILGHLYLRQIAE